MSINGTLYIGMTNDLEKRTLQHKYKIYPGFTSKYQCNKLVYYEEYKEVIDAIKREKQLKNWHRQWKLNLIKKLNPYLVDLSKEWF